MQGIAVGRTVIFHTRWMEFYSGNEEGLPSTHFRWLTRTGEQGGETENFAPLNDKCYGYVPFHSRTNVEKLNVEAAGDIVPGTLVVFTATSPEPKAGAKIVGWYEDASLYVDSIARPSGNRAPCKAIALASRAYLLPEDIQTRHDRWSGLCTPLNWNDAYCEHRHHFCGLGARRVRTGSLWWWSERGLRRFGQADKLR